MTDRLYYNDAYLSEFDAVVEKVSAREGKTLAALNRSAFYPTSGGQPFDTGTLNGARVTDVFADADGEVWHEVDGVLAAGEAVHGRIDWARRFDHMQQHGGEHMIAGAFYELIGGVTLGLHLGERVSSIDVEFADGATHAPEALIERVEDAVNARIQRDAPVRCWFPDADELARLPLRKKPTVSEHVRVVAMGDFEMVACGGTHPSSTGQIGLVKIVDAQPARGKLRVSFVCGRRAFEDYRENYNCAWAAAGRLSTRPEKLAEQIDHLQARLREAERALSLARREKLLADAPAMLASARFLPGGGRLVCALLDADASLLKILASALIQADDVVALLGARGAEKCDFVFARGAALTYSMGKLMADSARPLGGRGGGRPDFAQGGGPEGVLDAARELLTRGRTD